MAIERILVTGASGFIGHPLCVGLGKAGYSVVRCQRSADEPAQSADTRYFDLQAATPLPKMTDIDVVIHTAARVHVMSEAGASDLGAFRQTNVDATLSLARHAAASGVRRFVFLSSIKVNGEFTPCGRPFRADDIPAPSDPYSVSKWEAEVALRALAEHDGMDVVIIRPPLVYGPGVRANFRKMMRWVQLGIPLPLAGLDNRRSLVYLDNLVDLIVTCVDHPAAINQVFLASDASALSTSELLRLLAAGMDRRSRLIRIPTSWIYCFARLLGKHAEVTRLYGSLEVDIAKNFELLAWQPRVAADVGLAITAKAYLDQQEK